MKSWPMTLMCSTALHGALATGLVAGQLQSRQAAQPVRVTITYSSAASTHAGQSVSEAMRVANASTSGTKTAAAISNFHALAPSMTKAAAKKTTRTPQVAAIKVPVTKRQTTSSAAAADAAILSSNGFDQRPVSSTGDSAPSAAVGGSPSLVRSSIVEPAYGDDALRAGYEGVLIVDVMIDANGAIAAAKLKNPSGLSIDQGALRAARQARYYPATDADGRPVATHAVLKFNFQMR